MPPKYLDDAESRISSNVRKFQQIVTQAKSRGVNEADTRDIVKAIIAELLGFDPFFEVTGEFSIKGQFADFAVKQGDNILFFVEVKSIETKLDEKHLFQVIGYAANYGVEWAVLTNANRWIVYRLFSGDEKRTEVVVDIDLSDIGEFSLSPQDLVRMGIATPTQVAGINFKTSSNLNSLSIFRISFKYLSSYFGLEANSSSIVVSYDSILSSFSSVKYSGDII